jgi:hypothetical protein
MDKYLLARHHIRNMNHNYSSAWCHMTNSTNRGLDCIQLILIMSYIFAVSSAFPPLGILAIILLLDAKILPEHIPIPLSSFVWKRTTLLYMVEPIFLLAWFIIMTIGTLGLFPLMLAYDIHYG